jgi:hypothetical protein
MQLMFNRIGKMCFCRCIAIFSSIFTWKNCRSYFRQHFMINFCIENYLVGLVSYYFGAKASKKIHWWIRSHEKKITIILWTQAYKSTKNSDTISFCQKYQQTHTVKPVYNENPRDPKIVTVVDRWSLFKGHLFSKSSKWDPKKVVVWDKWSLFGGGR